MRLDKLLSNLGVASRAECRRLLRAGRVRVAGECWRDGARNVPEGAEICMDGGDVVIRIRDFGPGIPEEELPLVKKKFYKGSSKARGTGIGLAVCDEIIELHNGSLTLENAPGGGTLVTISLPVSQ